MKKQNVTVSKDRLFRELETLRKRNAELEKFADEHQDVKKALKESERHDQSRKIFELLQGIFDHSPSVIYVKDLKGQNLMVNSAFAAVVGLDPKEIVGKTDYELFPKEVADIYRDADRQVIDTGKPMKFEDTCPHEDGTHSYISLRFPLHNSNGEIYAIAGISTDINELMEAKNTVQGQLQFEYFITELSAKFINLPVEEVNEQIENGLKLVVTALEVDRSSLFQLSEDGTEMLVTHSFAQKGLEPTPRIQVQKDFPWAASKLQQGEILRISSLNDLPEEAALDRKNMARIHIKSTLIIPISLAGSINYVLTIGSLKQERSWDAKMIPRLQLIGEIFVNALERKKTDEKINHLVHQLESENIYLQEEVKGSYSFDEIVGKSAEIKYILNQVEQIAPTTTPVLILGETGTGKELIARAIHSTSDRGKRPLVKINCSTLPATLAESELFGHEKGAFTGANKQQIGRFEFADGATIFLDEIGDLPLELQPKLLRVLQDGEFERLGNPRTIKVDVRIIAATNLNLEKEIQEKRFRQDLFYRLNVFPLTIPPLRQRRDDIPLLVTSLVKKISKKMRKHFDTMPRQTIRKLQNYNWPGNIRELENLIERAVITSPEPKLRINLPEQMSLGVEGNKTLQEIDREYMLRVLKDTQWRIKGTNGAADNLGINPSTLRDRMKKLGIKRPN